MYTHANVASMEGDGGRIRSARVLDYRRRSFTFTADYFIVCCGTVESSRLLLSSAGVPNAHDQMGRYFHDHISLQAAVLPVATRRRVTQLLGPFYVDGVLLTPKIEAISALQRNAGLVAVMAHFTIEEPEDSGIGAVRGLLSSLQHGRLKEALTRNLVPMLRGVGDVMNLLWSSRVLKRRAIGKRAIVRMNIDMEQPGTAENRVRLSGATDALGLPKAIVDWRIGDAEYGTAAKFARIIKRDLEAVGISGLEWTPGLLEGERPEMADTFHAMGGLRMGTDPAESVVDTTLKVHGIENLYVASCAVYPSGGSSNPTFYADGADVAAGGSFAGAGELGIADELLAQQGELWRGEAAALDGEQVAAQALGPHHRGHDGGDTGAIEDGVQEDLGHQLRVAGCEFLAQGGGQVFGGAHEGDALHGGGDAGRAAEGMVGYEEHLLRVRLRGLAGEGEVGAVEGELGGREHGRTPIEGCGDDIVFAGDAGHAHLAGDDEAFEGFEQVILIENAGGGGVEQQHVDIVGAERTQAFVEGAAEGPRRRTGRRPSARRPGGGRWNVMREWF